MAETAFAEISPWSGVWRRGRLGNAAGEAGVTIMESSSGAMALMSLRRGSGAELARAVTAWGFELPMKPRWVKAQDLTLLWAGPGQWLLRRSGSFAQLEADLSGWTPHATLIDQSCSRAALTIGGPRVRDALAKGFEIDLHPRAFRPGDVAMTVAVGISALLWQLDDRPTYEVAVPRSMAGSFWHWLSDAAAEFGCKVGEG